MNKKCYSCGETACEYVSPLDGEPRCSDCARDQIRILLARVKPEDSAKLRRRIEDAIRKNPQLLQKTAVDLIVQRQISWDDLV